MKLPSEIADEVRKRIADAPQHRPGSLSLDRKAIMVDGGIGYGCWVSPDGDIYMETYDPLGYGEPVIDRSRRAQLLVLSLGARTLPQLRSLLPQKPAGVPPCSKCNGEGWFRAGELDFICQACCGLGWLEDT
jgi:hypothetical protein